MFKNFSGGNFIMTDKISDNLVEEILNDIKEKNGEAIPGQEYSLTDIDLLLAEISGEKTTDKESEVVFSKPEIKKEKEPSKKGFFSFDISKIQDFDDDEDESETEIETLEEETESQDDVSVSVEDDGQIGFTSEIVDLIVEEYKDAPVEEEAESVTGQISIEKTRMFNEIDIRGTYNPNISHNLGNKVVRTTSGDAEPLASASVMEEEKYRKHFMNKPVQKLENTPLYCLDRHIR